MATKLTNLTKLCTQIAERPHIPRQCKRFLTGSMKKTCERFQLDDGVPIYKKNGVGDMALMGFTSLLIVIGIADGLNTIKILSFPRKK